MASTLPKGFTARPATLDDVEAAVELANACSIELIGRPEWQAHEFRNDWQSPLMNPETDLLVVFDPDVKMVGYAGVWDAEPHVQLYGWGNVRPEYRGQGIGTYLAHWLEERAGQSIPQAPRGARVVLMQSKLAADAAGHAFLTAHGYQLVRYFTHMLIEMDAPPPAPVLPKGVAIRTFDVQPGTRQERSRAIVRANREIFRDHWGYVERPFEEEVKEWAHWIDHNPDYDPSLWFLAMEGDEIAGMSLCSPRLAEDPDMGHVTTLGVRCPWRRRGIALALLHHTFGEFYRRGKCKVKLEVDAASLTGATRLYEKAGMHVQRQSVTYEKELRPGKDLSTQAI
jgi:mycothiol synthase